MLRDESLDGFSQTSAAGAKDVDSLAMWVVDLFRLVREVAPQPDDPLLYLRLHLDDVCRVARLHDDDVIGPEQQFGMGGLRAVLSHVHALLSHDVDGVGAGFGSLP